MSYLKLFRRSIMQISRIYPNQISAQRIESIQGRTHIHSKGKYNHPGVKVEQALVFLKTARYKLCLHEIQEISVQPAVEQKKNDFFNAIPDSIDGNEPW
jgi:hypothetical protein